MVCFRLPTLYEVVMCFSVVPWSYRNHARTLPQGRFVPFGRDKRPGLIESTVVDFCLFTITGLRAGNGVYSGGPIEVDSMSSRTSAPRVRDGMEEKSN